MIIVSLSFQLQVKAAAHALRPKVVRARMAVAACKVAKVARLEKVVRMATADSNSHGSQVGRMGMAGQVQALGLRSVMGQQMGVVA